MKKRSLLYRIGRPRPVPVEPEWEEPKQVQADLTPDEFTRLRAAMASGMGIPRRFIDNPDWPPLPTPGPRAAIRYVPADAPEHFPDIVRVLEAAVADASRRFVGGPLTTSVLSMVAAHLRTGIEMYHRTAARLMEITYRVSVFVWDDRGTLNVEFSFVDVREEQPEAQQEVAYRPAPQALSDALEVRPLEQYRGLELYRSERPYTDGTLLQDNALMLMPADDLAWPSALVRHVRALVASEAGQLFRLNQQYPLTIVQVQALECLLNARLQVHPVRTRVWMASNTLNVLATYTDPEALVAPERPPVTYTGPPLVSSDFRNLVVQSGFGTQPGRVMGIDWGVDADEVGRSAARAFVEEARQIRAAAALEDGRAAARWAAPELGVPLQEPPATVYAPFVPVRSVRSTNDDLVDAINFQIEANNPAFVSPPLMPLLIEQQRQMVEQAPEEDATLGEVTPEMLRDEAFRMLQDTVANRSQNRRANRLARNLLRQQYCECQGNLMCRFCLTRENTQED